MEAGWELYHKPCGECGERLVIKKNGKGAMSTVKHEVPNKNCEFKFGSVLGVGKKGTERTEEKNGGAGEAKTAKEKSGSGGGASSGAGASSGGNNPGSTPSGKNGAGEAEGKNHGTKESYSDSLKRIYGS